MNSDSQTTTTPKVLIVEDEGLVAMDVEMQLISFGYEIAGIASSGKEALRLVETTRPDLILMDIHLRGPIDGIAIAAQLHQSGNVTPIVFVTAYGSWEAVRRADDTNCSGYLTKPYQPQQLRDAVRSALERPER